LDKENDILIYYNLWIGTKKELDYLQDLISNSIENQKTEIGKKALRQIIEDYNEWILGHKE
jgi:hypothetical protein